MRIHFISIPRALPEQPVAQGRVRAALRPLLAAPTRRRSDPNEIDENQNTNATPKSHFDVQEETWNHLLM